VSRIGSASTFLSSYWDPKHEIPHSPESFFSTLEAELLSRRRFASQAEAKMACFSYIEG
jgi:hypothetical protein